MSGEDRYIGLVTRTLAFALDLAIIYVVAVLAGAGVGLVLSLFHISDDTKTALVVVGGVVCVLWAVAYFVAFWSVAGQTPGDHVMRIRVASVDGPRLSRGRALIRCIGLVLSAIPLFAGYLMILFDSRRRALHDQLARTVVVEAPTPSLAELRRARRRQERALRSSDSGDEREPSAAQA